MSRRTNYTWWFLHVFKKNVVESRPMLLEKNCICCNRGILLFTFPGMSWKWVRMNITAALKLKQLNGRLSFLLLFAASIFSYCQKWNVANEKVASLFKVKLFLYFSFKYFVQWVDKSCLNIFITLGECSERLAARLQKHHSLKVWTWKWVNQHTALHFSITEELTGNFDA